MAGWILMSRLAALPGAFVVAVALAACSSASSSTTEARPSASITPAGQASALQQTYVGVIRRLLPSVVEIRTSSGLGSGVVYDSAGDIVTNAHVVGKATKFKVLLSNSATARTARLVGKYAPDDLAVIKVSDAAGLRPAVFADSDRLEVGDIVLAIGTPLGLTSTATQGIVSAIGRTVAGPS